MTEGGKRGGRILSRKREKYHPDGAKLVEKEQKTSVF